MYKITIKRKTNRITVKKVKPTIKVYGKSKRGLKGDTGEGVPTGGAPNQVLIKTGSADFATGWGDQLGANALQPGDNVSELVNDAGYLSEELFDIVVPIDYPTLTDALNAATAGSSIFVKSGNYSEAGGTFTTPNINVFGAGGATTTLTLADDFIINGDNVSLNNLAIDTNSGNRLEFAGNFNGLSRCRVINGTVTPFFKSGFRSNISNNRIESSSPTGTVELEERNTITGNFFVVPHTLNGGIKLHFYSVFTGNFIYRQATLNGGGPLLHTWGERVTISGNTFFCGLAKAIGSDFRTVITGNSIFQAGGNGIIVAIDGMSVTGNIIDIGVDGTGILVNGSDGGYSTVVSGNNITSSGAYPNSKTPQANHFGIQVGTGQVNAVISGNSIAGCGIGIIVNTGATNTLISDNAFTYYNTAIDNSGTGTVITDNINADNDPVVKSVTAGTNITIDNTDPENPVINAIGSGSGGGNWELIYDQTVPTDSNSWDITGLDLDTDGEYYFDFRLVNGANTNGWTIRVNAASTTYTGNGFRINGTSVTGSNSWANRLVYYQDLNPSGTFPTWGRIIRSPYGGIMITAEGINQISSSAVPLKTFYTIVRTQTANLTSLRIMPTIWFVYAGSRFKVWKRVT